jgi:A/G-specific adenine glycosylase
MVTTSGRNEHAAFRRALVRRAHALGRDLPWINDPRPWAVLVSEVMLQQTQTSRVLEPWRRFMERFPTPSACANASLADVLSTWQGLGYPRRAKALHETAQILRDDFNDIVPSSVEALRRLPGVGEYTAAAVASFAYGEAVAVLDTNVGRVLSRALANRRLRPSEARTLASELLPRQHAAAFNQSLLDLGAQFCRAVPRCDVCPMAKHCAWQAEGGEDPAPLSAAVSRRQSTFKGSNRQLRGRVLKALLEGPRSRHQLSGALSGVTDSRGDEVLTSLVHDGLITQSSRVFALPR